MPRRVAVKIAYDGRRFMGSQRQPDQHTVEGEVIRSLQEIEAITSAYQSRLKTASRTDRGVSALGNVVAFDTPFDPEELVRALNAVSDEVHFYALAVVQSTFSPRRASGRWYRYLLPSEDLDIDLAIRAATAFEGRHDFKRFCKNDDRATLRTLREVRVVPVGQFLVVDLRAREFLRNMVRRMVAAIDQVGRGNSTIDDVMEALSGEDTSFGLAPAERLCLMDVHYTMEFRTFCPRTLTRKLRRGEEEAFFSLNFNRTLLEKCSSR